MKYLNWRQRRSLEAYRRRLAEFQKTQQLPPDGRDAELKARGDALEWKRRKAKRSQRTFWNGARLVHAVGASNVVSIWEGRR